jgi:hypothetical protein
MPATQSSFNLIEDNWFTLRRSFDDAQQRLNTKADRDRLLADRDGARDAYYVARGKDFDEQDAFIKKTKKELKDAINYMKAELETLQNMANVLKAISSATKLAAALAGMAIV